jgi:hypothetical protein
MNKPTPPISPELLAEKIERIENFELPHLLEEFKSQPRLVRALWFLQWVSQPTNYPGGLSKFAGDLIQANVHRLGTPGMLKTGTHDKYREADAARLLRELRQLPESILENKNLTPATVRQALVDHASDNLGTYFKELCEHPHVGFRPWENGEGARWHFGDEKGAPWYFADVADAVLAFMDAREEELRSRIAETEITREIRRWTAKSRSMRRPVMFIGNTRFGKTESIKLEAAADPGNCRLVNTPSTNAIGDLLREVAKSLGIEVGSQSLGPAFQSRIDYVLRFSQLQLIFDEAQFLLPINYSRNTAPKRLNWVRRSIIDQGTPAIFVCTPQSYFTARKHFVKTTEFVMEQFDERLLVRQLPSELSEADLLAVARVHFPDLAEVYLGFVVDTVLATERNFVSDVEKIATLAKDNAREARHRRPTLSDIQAAVADVLPTDGSRTDLQDSGDRSPVVVPQESQPPRERKSCALLLPLPRRGLEISNRSRLERPEEVPV